MKDPIERQDALDAIDKRVQFLKDDPVFRRKHGDIDLYGIKPIIRALPSAQPDLNEWCTDCNEYDQETHSCPRFNRVIRETLKDASERKTGAWSVYDRHTIPYQYICSECGAYHRAMYDFCPSCGADMRENK